MSLRLFDFQCSAGHRNEMLVGADVRRAKCDTCGKPAKRLIAAPRCQLEGITGSFPGAADKWVKNRESKMAKERKLEESHGTYYEK